MMKKIFHKKSSEKKNVSVFSDINSMSAEELLGVGLKERSYSSTFQGFVSSFPEKVTKTLESATYDKHNHGFMDPIIDANVNCEKDNQEHSETVVRIAAADHLAGKAQEIKTVLEEDIAHKEQQLIHLENKMNKTVESYNKSTYESEEDYEVFENIDDQSVKKLKNGRGFSPAIKVLIVLCLCVADAVNLYTTFESIDMLAFAVQLIMVVTSALLLQILPFFCGKIVGELINTGENHKKKKTASKMVLAAVLVTVFIALCSGLTAVRFQVLEEGKTSVGDVTFSDTAQTSESETTKEETSGSEKGYAVFLTILMITTSAASFYLGFEDPLINEIHILNERINAITEDINSKKAAVQRLAGYTKEYLLQLDEMQKEAIVNHMMYEGIIMKIEARNMLYKDKNPEEISYIEESSSDIVTEGEE